MTITQISRNHTSPGNQSRTVAGSFSPEPRNKRDSSIERSGVLLDDSQYVDETHDVLAVVTDFPPATVISTPMHGSLVGSTSENHSDLDAQLPDVLGTSSPDTMDTAQPTSIPCRGALLYNGYLCLLSDSLDAIEDLRIATENRVRSLTRTGVDKDGELRGLGLDARSPEVARAIAMVESIKKLEHEATLELKREVRKSPLYGWVKRNKGIGEKQAARLLAVIGDPYWNDLHERQRTVSELWAYAGYSVVSESAQRRMKGVKSNWNDKAKSRAYLMSVACMKTPGGYYRGIYDAARTQYADAMHPTECFRCGPKGKPAQPGSPLTLGHQFARALRRTSKEILKDLWLEARMVHEGVES